MFYGCSCVVRVLMHCVCLCVTMRSGVIGCSFVILNIRRRVRVAAGVAFGFITLRKRGFVGGGGGGSGGQGQGRGRKGGGRRGETGGGCVRVSMDRPSGAGCY